MGCFKMKVILRMCEIKDYVADKKKIKFVYSNNFILFFNTKVIFSEIKKNI